MMMKNVEHRGWLRIRIPDRFSSSVTTVL